MTKIRPGGVSASQLSAAYEKRGPKLIHLNAYENFFASGKFITGQSTTGTTLTSAVTAGDSVLPVASATGIVAGQQLVVAEGTAQQRIYTVASVASSNVTINGTVAFSLANGAAVTPLWGNSTHLTQPGYKAFAYFIANAKDADGNYVIAGTAPKVVYLGDSWFANGAPNYVTQLNSRLPSAVGVNAGVAGSTSASLLTRFATDVPADATYVVFNEPGVNDVAGDVTVSTQMSALAELVRRIRALGAIPVFTGHVPLSDYARSLNTHQRFKSAIGDGTGFPGTAIAGLPSNSIVTATNIGIGDVALRDATGTSNTVLGQQAGRAVTSGVANTLVGQQAGRGVTSANYVTAFGQAALVNATGSDNTAVGGNAGLSVSSGTANTFIGKDAGWNVSGSTADATTTGSGNVAIGSGAGASGASSNATAVGASAKAGNFNATAIGKGTSATGQGSVAIGIDNASTAASTSTANEIALGTTLHTTKIAGYLQIDRGQTTVGAAGLAAALPATPTKYLSIKDSTGTEYVVPAYAKS